MSLPVPEVGGRPLGSVHCLGVGGMGLGPLAILLSRLGVRVSGEDDALGAAMREQLRRANVRIGEMDTDCGLLAVSSAIPASHPAARAAAGRGIPVMRRGELLAAVCAGRRLVAVCGAHGKTTTTAMLVHALRRAGRRPGYVLGGLFGDDGLPPADAGTEDWLVAEIDESDGTIAAFSPEITVLTNLDWDHPDFYRTEEQLVQTFRDLFARTRDLAVVSAACPYTPRITAAASRCLGFGLEGGDFSGRIVSETGDGLLLELTGAQGGLSLPVRARGEFNALNALAALAAATRLGVPPSPFLLADYPGVRRRQCRLGEGEDFVVVEDYAHHPGEISALLASLRTQVPAGARLFAAFQPHRFSRTAQFRTAFAEALSLADEVHLLEVYSAGEAPLEGGRVSDLAAAFPAGRRVVCHGEDHVRCFEHLGAVLRAGDWLAVIGAGDIDSRARGWLSGRRWDRWFSSLLAEGFSEGTRLLREEPLAQKTTMRLGGAARVYAEPSGTDDLRTLLRRAACDGVPVFPLGRGSNLLVPDEGVDGLVVSLAHPSWACFEPREDGRVWAGAGLRLKNLCGLASKAGLAGFEFLEGIPGCVGGSLRMNAGAMGGWIFDVVDEVLLMTFGGELVTRTRAELGVDYRQCQGLERAIALGALFRPAPAGQEAGILERLEAYRTKRQASQPREPSAGCIFKNPPGDSAGRLIDQCGLKGERVGAAQVSPIHANFIVNLGGATAADVLSLVRRVRAVVRERRGVDLEPEVLLFGSSWDRVL